MPSILGRIFSSGNEREVKRLWPLVEEVNDLEAARSQALERCLSRPRRTSSASARRKARRWTTSLPEAFAVMREAINRRLGQRAFDVQIIGAIVLHQGKIAELKTGEGKTLVATLAIYLNALEGRGAHLVTVNDYLAKRDAQWYGRVLTWLGLTVGVLQHDSSYLVSADKVSDDAGMEYLTPCTRQRSLRLPTSPTARTTSSASTTCATTWRRDRGYQVQRERHFAIVDEVDNILIDEARTPLIISGAGPGRRHDVYPRFARARAAARARRRLHGRREAEARLADRSGRREDREER